MFFLILRSYHAIDTGIEFYREVGCIFVDLKDTKCLERTHENAAKMGVISYSNFTPDGIKVKFPFLHFEKDWEIQWNFKNSGHINPRKLVAAQQKLAKSQGCEIFNDVVVAIKDSKAMNGGLAQLRCETGRTVQARKVLLCTGAFTNYHDLLPEDKKIDLNPCKTFVVFAEVSKEDAKKMASMPCILSNVSGKKSYTLPPIKYPDGKSVLAQHFVVS